METRIVKLLKILIKIAIMLLVMTGIILINRSYMKNADGSETDGRRVLIERVTNQRFIYTQKLYDDSYECIGSSTTHSDFSGSSFHFKFTMINRTVPKIKIDQALIRNTCFL